jgi:hypothetical protein
MTPRYPTQPPVWPGADQFASVMMVESLNWSNRPDVVAAGRFVVYRLQTGAQITVIDAYLQTDGKVEMWEDDGPASANLPDGDYSGRPSEEWREIVEPMFAATLRRSLEQQGQGPS